MTTKTVMNIAEHDIAKYMREHAHEYRKDDPFHEVWNVGITTITGDKKQRRLNRELGLHKINKGRKI